MLRRIISALVHPAAGFGARQCVALLALCALTFALAGPLLGLGFGEGPTYCCRSGRCCCDPGHDSSDELALETACRCARPDGTAIAFAIPLGLLSPGPALSDAAPAEPLASRPAPLPQDGETSPPDQPPRLSRIT